MDETNQPDQSHDEVFLTAVLFECALAAIALLLGWAIGPSARAMVPNLTAENAWPIISGIGLGLVAAVPVLVFVEVIRKIPWEPIQRLERLTEDGMFKVLLELRSSELILISLCAGIGEELLFRGWLMYWLAEPFAWAGLPAASAIVPALVLSSLVFGLFHPITPTYILLAALMGMYFGLLVIVTGNLLVPIVAHAAYDAVQLILTARSERSEEPLPIDGDG